MHREVQCVDNYINIGNMSEYNIIIERDNASGLYCGQCEQIPEAISQGGTEEELLDNIREAIELVLADRQEMMRVSCERMRDIISGREKTISHKAAMQFVDRAIANA